MWCLYALYAYNKTKHQSTEVLATVFFHQRLNWLLSTHSPKSCLPIWLLLVLKYFLTSMILGVLADHLGRGFSFIVGFLSLNKGILQIYCQPIRNAKHVNSGKKGGIIDLYCPLVSRYQGIANGTLKRTVNVASTNMCRINGHTTWRLQSCSDSLER